MGKKENAAEPVEQEWELEDIGPVESDRVVVLQKEPLSRKVHLMHAGVKEIRCICCGRIEPIASAEDLDVGWICGQCVSEATDEWKYGGLRRP